MKATYDTKQLLSKPISQKAKKGKRAKKHTQYEFLLRHRQKQQENKGSRRQAKIKEGDYSFGESNLGQYVDRLIAKSIVEIALRFRVSSIVLPDLTNIREITESEVQAKARIKNPGCKKAQKIYSKKYRKNLHQWSYKRLTKAIESQAVKKEIDIEYTLQKYIETPDIQAKNMVLNAYEQRKQLVK
ncbi:MAG: type V CRISPR-associated protein Cas12k [Cyanobacteria bacterium J06621_8]